MTKNGSSKSILRNKDDGSMRGSIDSNKTYQFVIDPKERADKLIEKIELSQSSDSVNKESSDTCNSHIVNTLKQ